ncbi:MAG: N-acetylmuramoyl-L-alanine amidase, partial [Candidatus Flemingiibacterium sp.]
KDGQIIVELRNPTTLPDTDKPLEGKVIVLDAGHGGKNPGALGPLGAAEGAMNESDFNLEIVMAAVPKLEALGATVILTRDRETEIDVPVPDRVAQLIELDPDLCVSIHQNSMPYTSDVTKIHGLVGLYWSDSGYMLTSVMGKTMSDALNKLNRSPVQQRLAMVRNPKFPSTLIEVCFITNVEEYERMMRPDSIDRISDSIADGILNYYAAQAKYLNY